MNQEANNLTAQMAKVVDFSIDNLEIDDLIEIKNKMENLIEQEEFWMKQENENRFVFELKNFLTWLSDYALLKHSESEEEKF
jgi:hypothetical protein